MAPRPDGRPAARPAGSGRLPGPGLRLRGGPVDGGGGDRRGGAGAGADGGPIPALLVSRRVGLRRQNPLGHARRLRRPPGEAMSGPPSRALVFYGATGDLAFKKIFPALQRMVKGGKLDVPVIGMARQGWSLEPLRPVRGRASSATGGGSLPAPSRRSC